MRLLHVNLLLLCNFFLTKGTSIVEFLSLINIYCFLNQFCLKNIFNIVY